MKDTSGLTFEGAGGAGYSRNNSAKVLVNKHTGHMNDGRLVNKGRGPTKGNQDMKPMNVGPSATKDGYRAAPTSTMPTVKPGKDMFMGSSNPQVRTPGGTRAWDPKCGQNYKGDADRINVSGYSMGDGKMEKGGMPKTKAGNSNFNYGPKSQY
jgi:hypothetical protein